MMQWTLACLCVLLWIGGSHQVSVNLVGDEELSNYQITPFGYMWRSCVHKVESGSHIEERNGRTYVTSPLTGEEQLIPKCDRPRLAHQKKILKAKQDAPDDGWQVWSSFNNVNNATFTSYLGKFNVPAEPVNFGGGILYMFTGLQNDNWIPMPSGGDAPPGFDIIQPVLQFGDGSANGGGDWWGLASWYVTLDDGALWTDMVNLNAGDIIIGNMTKTAPTTWYIGGQSSQTGQSTSFSVTKDRLNKQPWAYCTLELYNLDSCDSLPPSDSPLKFTELMLTDANGKVAPQWQPLNNQAGHCTSSVTVTDATSVTITF